MAALLGARAPETERDRNFVYVKGRMAGLIATERNQYLTTDLS